MPKAVFCASTARLYVSSLPEFPSFRCLPQIKGSWRSSIRVIGLTGGISCGKSTVADILREQGYTVIDADQIARDIVQPGTPALEQIRVQFGNNIVNADGRLDRRALGRIVFSDSGARTALEKITHPAIFRETRDRLSQLENTLPKGALVFYENALFYETGSNNTCEAVIAVTATVEKQKQRLLARDPDLSVQECEDRISSQWPVAKKAALADHVIPNNGSLDELLHAVKKCLATLEKNADG